jgi:hypothetical protein
MLKLSKRAREVLTILQDTEDELLYSGGQWWIDNANIRLGRTIPKFFLENVLISVTGDKIGKIQYYYINDAGRRLLAGEEKLYRAGSGIYYESLEALRKGEGLK